MKREKEIEKEILEGRRIRFRNREQITTQKEKSMVKHPDTWFLRGEFQNTLKVNSLYKHHTLNHANSQAKFASKSVRKGIRFTMDRYITEALLIEESNQDPNVDLLNNRSEWGQRGVPRVQFNV